MSYQTRVRRLCTGADGDNTVALPFQYSRKSDVKVFLDDVEQPFESFTFLNAGTIQLSAANSALAGKRLLVLRKTSMDEPEAVFAKGGLDYNDLNAVVQQGLYIDQESSDLADTALNLDATGSLDARGLRIKNVAAPIAATDAVPMSWAAETINRLIGQVPATEFFARAAEGGTVRTLQDKVGETVSILDFSPDLVAVDGGDAGRFSFALAKGIEYLANSRAGGELFIPPSPNGQPYLLHPAVYDVSGATNNVRVYGAGVVVEPAEPSDEALFALKDGWFEMDGITFNDPNGYLTIGAIIETSATEALPQRFRNLKATNVKLMWCNKGAHNVGFTDFHGINVDTFYLNQSGGVGNFIDGLWVQGGKYGIVLDGMQGPTDHSEGFMLSNANILCTQDNSIGIQIIDALLVQINTVVVGQMGTGGSCIVIAPQEAADGVIMVQAHQVYLDAGEGGWCIDMLAGPGNIRNNTFNDVVMSFKGGVPNTNGIRMYDCSDIVLDRVRTFQGLTGKDAEFVNCVNIECQNTDFSSGSGVTENSACRINWDVEDYRGIPAARSPLSMYPRASWYGFATALSSAAGTFAASGTVGGADFRYRKVGRTVDFAVTVTVSVLGTASSVLVISLPYPASNQEFAVSGYEDVQTGKMLQGRIAANSSIISVLDYAGAFPVSAGAQLTLTGRYETTS